AHPALSARRLASAREWLVQQGFWDANVRSYLDEGLDSSSAFGFVDGWIERVASGASDSADLDLVAAIDRFRDGLSEVLWREFPGTCRRAACAALGPGGAVLARPGAAAGRSAGKRGSRATVRGAV